jgi:hypothetical protein
MSLCGVEGCTSVSASSLRVCMSCLNGWRRDLRSLPELYRASEIALTNRPKPQEKVSRQRPYGIMLNTDVVDARDALLSRLASWSGLVADERLISAPQRSVTSLARFLLRHTDWLCAHACAPDAVGEIRTSTTALRRAVFPSHTRRFSIGRCVMAGCVGTLMADMNSAHDVAPAEVWCNRDPEHRWPADRWRELDRRVRRREGPSGIRWLTAPEVATLWNVSVSNVYRLASMHKWRRRTQGRRAFYCEADIADTVGLQRPDIRPLRSSLRLSWNAEGND